MPIGPGSRITEQSIRELVDEQIHINRHDDLVMEAKRIILSFDTEYIEDVMNKMDSPHLDIFIKHLIKVKLLAEKILFDRT